MKKIIILILFLLTGCASVNVTPPIEAKLERSRTYQLSFEKTWIKAVDWFADHDVSIEKIEKSSGLITAKYKIKVDDSYLDCGEITATGILGTPDIQKYGSLNVTVRSLNESESKVNVNFFGEYKLNARDSWDGRSVHSEGDCVSKGELEKNILGFIGK